MLAATLADGHTVIRPAAHEPEVDDLIAFLQKMGAEVERTYPDTIEVEGQRRLRGAEHQVMPDRIEAGTFVVAAAVTGGHVTLEGAPCDTSTRCVEVARAGRRRGRLRRRHDRGRRARPSAAAGSAPSTSRRRPYPGLATDLQPPTAVLLPRRPARRASTRRSSRTASTGWASCADGRRGSSSTDAHHAAITGPRALHGAEVEIGDLRAGASLILAALAADGHVARFTARTTSSGGMRTSSASSSISAPGSSASPKGMLRHHPHEDRHRSRHGQRPRLRQGQGHRHPGAVRGGGRATTTGSWPWARKRAR